MSNLQDAVVAGGSRLSMEAAHNDKLRSEEDGGSMDKAIHTTEESDHVQGGVTVTERAHLKQGLEQRHLSMIALAGSIGTGLFLSLGGSIQTGGPLGALLGYLFVGAIVCAVQFALGEVSALLPVTGSFVRHADYLIDPAWGFAVGWNLVYGNLLSIPSEISAICVLFQFWTDINSSLFIVIFIVLTFAVGVVFVRIYGEVEFAFASLKLLTIVFLIIFGLVTNLGGIPGVERIGFRYWNTPGPFVEHIATGAWGRFLGFYSCLISSVFFIRRRRIACDGGCRDQESRSNYPARLQEGLPAHRCLLPAGGARGRNAGGFRRSSPQRLVRHSGPIALL